MIYELNRFYLGAHSLDATSDPPEQLDWNSCVSKLDMIQSIINPTNLELYVARKSYF